MREMHNVILHRAGAAIERLGLRWEVLHGAPHPNNRNADHIMRIYYPGGEIEFEAEVKAHPTPLMIDLLRWTANAGVPRLLIADYVNPKLAERLREQGVNFVDAAGNAYIHHVGLYVWIQGEKDALRLKAERERRRAFQPTGLKVIFAVLCRPELTETDYRRLARTAGVALGTVQWVMRDLISDGYVMKLGRFDRRLVAPKELLDAWVPAFGRDLRPRLLLGRFEADDIDWWRDTDLQGYGAMWGGDPAAARLTGYVKPGGLTIYAAQIPARLVVEKRLRKDDAGRIEFRKKFWHFEGDERMATVPPVLVYADLLALAEPRAREVAERLYDEEIDGPFREHLARWNR